MSTGMAGSAIAEEDLPSDRVQPPKNMPSRIRARPSCHTTEYASMPLDRDRLECILLRLQGRGDTLQVSSQPQSLLAMIRRDRNVPNAAMFVM